MDIVTAISTRDMTLWTEARVLLVVASLGLVNCQQSELPGDANNYRERQPGRAPVRYRHAAPVPAVTVPLSTSSKRVHLL